MTRDTRDDQILHQLRDIDDIQDELDASHTKMTEIQRRLREAHNELRRIIHPKKKASASSPALSRKKA